MRKFVATAAVAASAAATVLLAPLSAHAASPLAPGSVEVRTNCSNGVSGYAVDPGGAVHSFALSPGTEYDLFPATTGAAGVWSFNTNQPQALESYGPALDEDKSWEFAVQRVEKASVLLDDGRASEYYNDKANSFSFNDAYSPATAIGAHVNYVCGVGKS